MFNRQLIFRTVVPKLRRQKSEDDGELTDPLPDKLRSSVVCNCYVCVIYSCMASCLCDVVAEVKCNSCEIFRYRNIYAITIFVNSVAWIVIHVTSP